MSFGLKSKARHDEVDLPSSSYIRATFEQGDLGQSDCFHNFYAQSVFAIGSRKMLAVSAQRTTVGFGILCQAQSALQLG